jgi:hypothetical protein
MNFDKFDADIEKGLEHQLFVTADHLRTIEEEVIVCLAESVNHGWLNEDEAIEQYRAWRANYLPIGKLAVQAQHPLPG